MRFGRPQHGEESTFGIGIGTGAGRGGTNSILPTTSVHFPSSSGNRTTGTDRSSAVGSDTPKEEKE